jgi:hypothetical protein
VFNVRDDRDKQHSVSVSTACHLNGCQQTLYAAELDADADDVEYAGKL